MEKLFFYLYFFIISSSFIFCNHGTPTDKIGTGFFKGDWVYRSMLNIPDENIPFCEKDTATNNCESPLEFATAVMKFNRVTNDSIFGTLDMGETGILNLYGKIDIDEECTRFDLQGEGVANSNTKGWLYNYKGFVIKKWEHGINQIDACVGSVIRSKDHNGAKAGKVASFYMLKKS